MSQLYGRSREKLYTPSHGYGQNVYLVARPSRPDETYQTNKKPVVFKYYPSGKTGPQRRIAEVQTVSREVSRHPVPLMEAKKDYPTHVDGQSRRDDEFITKQQDAAIRANAGKLLGINLDRVQGDQVIYEDGVHRNIQPSDYHGNNAIRDGWSMQPTSIDETNPKKAAELFNKASNWRGTSSNWHRRSSDTYDGWNNNPSSRYGGYGSYGKLDDSYPGRNNNPQTPLSERSYNGQGEKYIGSSASKGQPSTPQGYYQTTHFAGDPHKNSSINGNYGNSDKMVSGNHDRLDVGYTRKNSPQAPRAGSGYTGQTENLNGSSGLNKPLPTQQHYDQPTSYEGDIHKYPGGMNSNLSDSDEEGYGNRSRLDDSLTKKTNSRQAPQAASGYTGKAENFKGNSGLNKPLSTQQGYDQRVSYGGDTRKNPSSMSGNYSNSESKGYGNSAKPDYSYNIVRPAGTNRNDITTEDAVRLYNGAYVNLGDSYTGWSNSPDGACDNMVSGNHGRLDDSYTRRNSPQEPRAGNGYVGQTENLKCSNGRKECLPIAQGYHQTIHRGGDTRKNPNNINGSCGNSDNMVSGNSRLGSSYTGQTENLNGTSGCSKPLSTQQAYDGRNNNPQAQRAGRGYTGQTENLNGSSGSKKPLSIQHEYDDQLDYDAGIKGSIQGCGYDHRIDTMKLISMINIKKKPIPEYEAYGNGYNSSSGTNTVRPAGTNPTVINSSKAKE